MNRSFSHPRHAVQTVLAATEADTYLVELKAAAIDVVAEHAASSNRRVVFARNELVGDGIDEALLALAPVAA